MATTIMYTFQDCLSSEVNNIAFVPGTLIYCRDTGESYYDTLDGDRIAVSKYVVICLTDSDRTDIIAPDSGCLYVVIETKRIWVYNGGWKDLTKAVYFDILNVDIAASTTSTITDSKITSACTAKFIPLPNIADLYTDGDITLTCATGSISVKNNSSYEMIGTVQVTLP